MTDFIQTILNQAKAGKLPVKRTKPSLSTDFCYSIVIVDPQTDRVVVATGSTAQGDDWSWGVEAKAPEDKARVLADL
jgi:hypothetical protein